jgi:hypothetical protein
MCNGRVILKINGRAAGDGNKRSQQSFLGNNFVTFQHGTTQRVPEKYYLTTPALILSASALQFENGLEESSVSGVVSRDHHP